jgi:hypothetical protein
MTLPGQYRHHPPIAPPTPPLENRARQSGPIDYTEAPVDAETVRLVRARTRRRIRVVVIGVVVFIAVVGAGWALLR